MQKTGIFSAMFLWSVCFLPQQSSVRGSVANWQHFMAVFFFKCKSGNNNNNKKKCRTKSVCLRSYSLNFFFFFLSPPPSCKLARRTGANSWQLCSPLSWRPGSICRCPRRRTPRGWPRRSAGGRASSRWRGRKAGRRNPSEGEKKKKKKWRWWQPCLAFFWIANVLLATRWLVSYESCSNVLLAHLFFFNKLLL